MEELKDLSRFGREHIMVDSYTQVYFPENGIRFIAIYDNIDITPRSHYDLMMNIKSVINEYYGIIIMINVMLYILISRRESYWEKEKSSG